MIINVIEINACLYVPVKKTLNCVNVQWVGST